MVTVSRDMYSCSVSFSTEDIKSTRCKGGVASAVINQKPISFNVLKHRKIADGKIIILEGQIESLTKTGENISLKAVLEFDLRNKKTRSASFDVIDFSSDVDIKVYRDLFSDLFGIRGRWTEEDHVDILNSRKIASGSFGSRSGG